MKTFRSRYKESPGLSNLRKYAVKLRFEVANEPIDWKKVSPKLQNKNCLIFCLEFSFKIVPHLNGSSFQNAGRILSRVSFGSASPSAKLARMLSSSSVSSSSGSASVSPPAPSSPSAAPSPSPPLGPLSASTEQVKISLLLLGSVRFGRSMRH